MKIMLAFFFIFNVVVAGTDLTYAGGRTGKEIVEDILNVANNSGKSDKILSPENIHEAITLIAKEKIVGRKTLGHWADELYTTKENTLQSTAGHLVLASRLDHILILPDGNRRWAQERGIALWDAYESFRAPTAAMLQNLFDHGVNTVTFLLASPKNFTRDLRVVKGFVQALNGLVEHLRSAIEKYHLKIRFVGDKKLDPKLNLDAETIHEVENTIALLNSLETETQNQQGNTLNLVFNFSEEEEQKKAMLRVFESFQKNLQNTTASPVACSPISEAKQMKSYFEFSNQRFPNIDLSLKTGSNPHGGKTGSLFSMFTQNTQHLFMEEFYPDMTEEMLYQTGYFFLDTLHRNSESNK